MDKELISILTVANQAASQGAEVLRKYWHEGVELRDKSDNGGKSYDLVSDADLDSEKAIAACIDRVFPKHELLGEEELSGDLNAEHVWIIDPLDGTNNFAHRIPHFAVSIAYYRSGVPTVGVVHNPITGDRFGAVLGNGAWSGASPHDGTPIQVNSASTLKNCMVGCGFYYDRGKMMRQTLKCLDDIFQHDVHGIRRMGTAALDLCFVARGCYGAYFEYKLSPWDYAAGQLIVKEAGGLVSTGRGHPLGTMPTSVLASNRLLHPVMQEITTRHHP